MLLKITTATPIGRLAVSDHTMSAAVKIAAALVRRGKRILGIDLDPQANMSEYLGYEYNTLYSICDLMIAAANNDLSDEIIVQSIVHNKEGK